MYILLWECEYHLRAKLFENKKELEDYLNSKDSWLLGSINKRVFCGTESRLQTIDVESYVIEKKIKVYP